MLLFMLTARPKEALPYAKGCLLFVGLALNPVSYPLHQRRLYEDVLI